MLNINSNNMFFTPFILKLSTEKSLPLKQQ